MEHLALEVFDLATKENPRPTGSQYAVLEPDATITITDTSEIFADGDVWSYDFTLNVHANAHIFGTAGDIHGSRLHEQIDKRKARLWAEGVPLYLGYLKLGDEAEVDAEGNVDVSFESGQKTFEEMIEGTSAQEVSVGDVVIGVALNRKRVSVIEESTTVLFTLNGLEVFAAKDPQLEDLKNKTYSFGPHEDSSKEKQYQGSLEGKTPYVQRWPKLVKSHGEVLDSSGNAITLPQDYINVQTPYDDGHPFCNINICYPLKINDKGEEKAARGYTLRLAYSATDTTDGGDHQTRFNNAPNFYLLYFIDRLFKDMGIRIMENQAKDVEDLRRVFMLNYGCHYEEIEDEYEPDELLRHTTPRGKVSRYGQYYIQIIRQDDMHSLLKGWDSAGEYCYVDPKSLEHKGKVLLRNVSVTKNGSTVFTAGSVEGIVQSAEILEPSGKYMPDKEAMKIDRTEIERPQRDIGYYSAYLAYATGENYPKVEISEVINAMKSMFGVRLLFSSDYSTVRIILLRNVFRNQEVQDIACDIVDEDKKIENSIRGFRMTYGKGTDNTSFYYKGFADMFQRAATTWKDTTDRHDYSQWDLNANYDEIKQYVSAFNRMCYVTPVNGNAYGTQVDEDEDVLFPSLFEWAGYMDAEDGDCSQPESEGKTIEVVQCGATPVLMNEIDTAYASLFTGDLKAPAPEILGTDSEKENIWKSYVGWLATYGRVTPDSLPVTYRVGNLTVTGDLDIYLAEGFRIRLLDNYAISNGGTPFDEADPGLCFGIMRSSGSDAYVRYFDDPDDDENGELDTWEVVPGDGAIDHPDTCDAYGKEWDYDGSRAVITQNDAIAAYTDLYPGSNAVLYSDTLGYITDYMIYTFTDSEGSKHKALVVTAYSKVFGRVADRDYFFNMQWQAVEKIMQDDAADKKLIVEMDSCEERGRLLKQLSDRAYHTVTWRYPILIDNGIGSSEGRFSLKLRAEKPNPYFNPNLPENSTTNRRYLTITNENLRQRGLADQFYKEYSFWVRNARIVKRTVRMTLAQLQTIDKTKRVRVGDVTGFIRKMQYSVSNETGLGNVVLEIMYI